MTTFWGAMLVCADLERSRQFYSSVLGLAIKDDNSPRWVEFALPDGAALVLHPKNELIAVRPGSLQLGFHVDNVDKFIAGCAGSSVPVFQDPYDEPFGRIAVIGDPDGYPIQIVSAARTKRTTA